MGCAPRGLALVLIVIAVLGFDAWYSQPGRSAKATDAVLAGMEARGVNTSAQPCLVMLCSHPNNTNPEAPAVRKVDCFWFLCVPAGPPSPPASGGAVPGGPLPDPAYVPPVPAGPGVVYTRAQMEQALQAAGVPEPAAHTGAAIGMAESGGRSDAVHLCPPRCDPGQGPERSYGPWQLNLIAHPRVTVACAEALGCAAQQTAAISGHGSNWTPWTTFTSGAWRKYA